tara:strand:+ start:164 stop:451 length:288 start_codon:yes stop_codon:yes gene_type:complete
MRFFFAVLLTIVLHASFLSANEPSFKFTFGGNLGKIPLEINKMSKNIKPLAGIKINSWTLSPNFSSFNGDEIKSNFTKKKENIKDYLYIKINFKF